MKARVKYTLVSDMHFRIDKMKYFNSLIKSINLIMPMTCLWISILVCLPLSLEAEVLERVVAIVGEEAILLSDFLEEYERARNNDPKVTEGKVLNDMVDRNLLIHQAKKFSLGTRKRVQGSDEETELVKSYIERRIKSLIHIPFEDIEDYINIDKNLQE